MTVKSKNLFQKNPVIVLFTAPGKLFFRNNLKEMSEQLVQQNCVVFLSCHTPHFRCKTLDSFKEAFGYASSTECSCHRSIIDDRLLSFGRRVVLRFAN
jgi:hypothetical protein